MTPENLPALLLFALVSVMTPGPNNLMLMTSGANFGLRRTVPHMLGIGLGFPMMIILVGLGVMQLFDLWPQSYLLLKIASVVYMIYLAWKIAHAAPPQEAEATGKPLTFVQAAAFQWVNPKAWSMGLSAITLYAAGHDLGAMLWVAAAFAICGVLSTSVWTIAGQQVRRVLRAPRRLRAFNWAMAALLVASLLPVLIH
ncbi:MAG: LysE family translocator [Rhodobacterales bacterium]|nr:LysE family translocator [Puniceibacterium antarcticum]